MNILIVVGIALIIIVGIIALIAMGSGSPNRKKNELVQLRNQIKALQPKATSSNPSDRKDALIQADSLFSKGMKIKLGNNNSAGENLKELHNKYERKQYNQIWEAHKKRNRVVHENEELSATDAKKYVKTLEKAINNLI